MKLGIEIITGRFFYIEIGEEETVGSLKREIANKEPFKESKFLLIDKTGRQMADDQCKVLEYDCHDGSILHLIFVPIESSYPPDYFEDNGTLIYI